MIKDKLTDIWNPLRNVPALQEKPISPEQQSPWDFGHVSHDEAFGKVGMGAKYKRAADAHLPWLQEMTLNQHTIREGMWQGFNGFMGYPALSLLRQNGFISACLGTLADEMTRNWIQVTRNGVVPDKQDDDVKAVEDQMLAYDLRNIFNEVIRETKLFGGVMLFANTGASDKELLYPLSISNYSEEARRVKYFQIIEPINLFPGVYNSIDPMRNDYFEPQTWYVIGRRVHASRMAKFVTSHIDQVLKPTYNFFGIPHAQILWDYVIHFNACRIASANGVTNKSRTYLKTDMGSLLSKDGGFELMNMRLAAMTQSQNGSVGAIDFDNEDLGQLNMPLEGMADITRQAMEMICVANQSPAVKTLGYSPSGFSATGESDAKNWYDHVHSEQEHDIQKQLEWCFKICQLKALGRIDPTIGFIFAPLSEDRIEQKASVNQTMINSIVQLYDRGLLEPEEAREIASGFDSSIFKGINTEIDTAELPDIEPRTRPIRVDGQI